MIEAIFVIVINISVIGIPYGVLSKMANDSQSLVRVISIGEVSRVIHGK